ncbi:MAG: 16S rRNA (cytidine(1402)-2'-O)-methyltransferase [Christensenellaceae bacterium]|jgi:16S rRNA (cytidine1402-2'-O)-methyltransferase|nr:16S rRNA (cytidine(1402)-2'-O)-methyltransferase [Christensenellaceae bacterium]
MGVCYIVGTPIGNIKDITIRAIETLSTVDVIAAEDTRHTRILLDHYNIKKRVISYHEHNEKEATEKIIAILDSGQSVALVSDAGMPGISDPGSILINALQHTDHTIVSVPGPSAVTTAVSLTGTKGGFIFLGFLPEKRSERVDIIESFKDAKLPIVLYAAPHNIEKDLTFLYSILGDRNLLVVKELTKLFESIYRGTLSQINIENKKGEFVLIVDCAKPTQIDDETIIKELKTLLSKNISKSDAVKATSLKLGVSKNLVYSVCISNQDDFKWSSDENT